MKLRMDRPLDGEEINLAPRVEVISGIFSGVTGHALCVNSLNEITICTDDDSEHGRFVAVPDYQVLFKTL